jgi:hypothetical protein
VSNLLLLSALVALVAHTTAVTARAVEVQTVQTQCLAVSHQLVAVAVRQGDKAQTAVALVVVAVMTVAKVVATLAVQVQQMKVLLAVTIQVTGNTVAAVVALARSVM